MPLDLLTPLRLRGRMQAGALVQALGVSRPTLSRAVRAAGDQVVTLGQARRTSYAARRLLRGSAAPLRLYRVDPHGDLSEVGLIHLTHPPYSCALEFSAEGIWPLEAEMREGWFDGLPYPLYDMRPQGFLGRHFARRHAELLQVDDNPERWSDDDVLHALSLLGDDTPGNLIVGETAGRRWLDRVSKVRSGESLSDIVGDEALEAAYPRLARQAMAEGIAGSSAGGEFPKFTAIRRDAAGECRHVLVKFSGSDDAEGTRRWADLLTCEHLALEVLRDELGLEVAQSTLHRAAGRTFLEVVRFDRQGLLGRSPIVSWAALNGALFGVGKGWGDVGRLLAERGWLPEADVPRLERLGLFGQLIANSDMHDGNLSFVPSARGVSLAPAYDMLPMLYAPQRGVELPPREYTPKLPLPAARDAWEDAARAAVRFWHVAGRDARISAGFQSLCTANADLLRKRLSR